MAYLAGNTILDDEYNTFATGNIDGTANNTNNNVNTVGAAGATDRGYGQTAVTAVTAGTVISATQWASLLNKITTYANHQGSSITAITNPVATDPIAVLTALAGNISTITTNRHEAAASGTPYTTGGVIARTDEWIDTVTVPTTVTFGSEAEMRYFFNAGGRVSVAFARSGGTANTKNTGWTNLCAACGTINLTGIAASKTIAAVAYTGTTKIGGSGSPTVLATGTGVFALGVGFAGIFKQFDSAYLYTPNYIQLNAKVVGAVLSLTVDYVDDHVQRDNTEGAPWSVDEIINGTLTTTVTVIPPSVTYLSNSWGTPVIAGGDTALITEIDAIDMVGFTTYQVVSVGTSDFTLVGAASNAVDETFTPNAETNSTATLAGSFVIGKEYIITKLGTTDFTLIGASSTTLGVVFVATGVGAGTGKAKETGAVSGTGTVIAITPATVNATAMIAGVDYQVVTVGTSDFTLFGGFVANSVNKRFTPSDTKITAGSFEVGKEYIITNPQATNFTLIGAADSNVNTIFTATGVGTGGGEADETGAISGTGTVIVV